MPRGPDVLASVLFFAGLAVAGAGAVLLGSARGLAITLVAAGVATVVASTFVRASPPRT
jgi:hypothetical protein